MGPTPQENVRLGKKLATGGFGTVYRADLVDDESGDVRAVIVKKVRQAGRAHVVHTVWRASCLLSARHQGFLAGSSARAPLAAPVP